MLTGDAKKIIDALINYEAACKKELDAYVAAHGGDWKALYFAHDPDYVGKAWQFSSATAAVVVAQRVMGIEE